MLFDFRSSQVKLQNFQHQPMKREAVQCNDLHEYGTIYNETITRSNNVEGNKEEKLIQLMKASLIMWTET